MTTGQGNVPEQNTTRYIPGPDLSPTRLPRTVLTPHSYQTAPPAVRRANPNPSRIINIEDEVASIDKQD